MLLVAAGSTMVLLAGCGTPPEPLPTAPPRAPGGTSGSPGPGGQSPAVPGPSTLPGAPGGLPGVPGAPGVPGGGLPGAGLPPITYAPPLITVPPPTPSVPGAKKCTQGPTEKQLLATLRDRPGIPTGVQLTVTAGPYCASGWQFATVELKSADDERFDPLLVVTKGKPTALVVVEAGADVCSEKVQSDAPPGIRVRACGS